MEITELLYTDKTKIESIKIANKMTNSMVPPGIDVSKARPSTVMSRIKFSNIMLLMDELLVRKSVNALENDTGVYCELSRNGKLYAAFTDGVYVNWVEDIPDVPYNLMPLFLYTLKKTQPASVPQEKEYKNVFERCCEEYQADDSISLESAGLLCDSFFYNYIYTKTLSEFKENANFLEKETIQQGYSTSLLNPMTSLKIINDKAAFKLITVTKRRSSKTQIVNNTEYNIQDCIDGKSTIEYNWNEKQAPFIPSRSTLLDYVPEKAFFSSLKKINTRLEKVLMRMDTGKEGVEAIGNDYLNFFVVGKPGTGKTTMAYALGAATGMPTYTISVSKHTEEDTFEGMNKVIDGGFQFVPTDFLDAYKNGGLIIIEEINLADPAVIMGAIGQAIEPPFILKENGYKRIRRHPLCVIIGTMNIGTYGSKGVNQALSSRFKQTYILDDPEKSVFIDILQKQGYKKTACNYVYNAYTKITNYLKSPNVNREEICLNLSIRTCLGALQNYDDGDSMKDAMMNSFVGKIYEIDPDLALDIKTNIIDTLPVF